MGLEQAVFPFSGHINHQVKQRKYNKDGACHSLKEKPFPQSIYLGLRHTRSNHNTSVVCPDNIK